MPSPKDWFRRRRPDSDVVESDRALDPLIFGDVLELKRSQALLPEEEVGPELRVVADSPRRGPIPPPPPRLRGQTSFRATPDLPPPPNTSPQTHNFRPSGGSTAELTAAATALRQPPHEVKKAGPRFGVRPAAPTPTARAPEPNVDGIPGFTLAAPGAGWLGRQDHGEGAEQAVKLREAFTPTRPKQQGGQFSGRFRQMQRIISAIEEERAHVVIYGERGSGKTSLANIIGATAEQAGYLVHRFACSSELSFEDIFRGFLRRVPITALADSLGATNRHGVEHLDELLPAGDFGPAELIEVFEKLDDRHLILIVDEYDRVTDEITKGKLAELLKNMSDAAVSVSLVLIGVADDVDQLLGKHPSLQRTLVTIPLPLMNKREIEGIIIAGEQKTGLNFEPAIRQSIVDFAQGLPYHAQLLSLFAARSAVRRGSHRIEHEDLTYAVQRSVEEAEVRVREAYNLAIASSGGGTSFKDVVFAAACARSDEYGFFTVADIAASVEKTGTVPINSLSLQYPLKKLTDKERGAVLRRTTGPDGLRYQFCNQMMRYYVLIRQAKERGLV